MFGHILTNSLNKCNDAYGFSKFLCMCSNKRYLFSKFFDQGFCCMTASPSIRPNAIIKAYRAAIGHVFERGERPGPTKGPLIPTWTQLNGVKDSLDTNKKIAGCYARLRKKPCGHAKWNPFAPYESKEAYLSPPPPAPASLLPPTTPQKRKTA